MDGFTEQLNGSLHVTDLIVSPLKMCLQFVLSIITLLDTGTERVVHIVELAPHPIGACPQKSINFTSQFLRALSFSLRPGNVLLCEFHPRVGDGDCVVNVLNTRAEAASTPRIADLMHAV